MFRLKIFVIFLLIGLSIGSWVFALKQPMSVAPLGITVNQDPYGASNTSTYEYIGHIIDGSPRWRWDPVPGDLILGFRAIASGWGNVDVQISASFNGRAISGTYGLKDEVGTWRMIGPWPYSTRGEWETVADGEVVDQIPRRLGRYPWSVTGLTVGNWTGVRFQPLFWEETGSGTLIPSGRWANYGGPTTKPLSATGFIELIRVVVCPKCSLKGVPTFRHHRDTPCPATNPNNSSEHCTYDGWHCLDHTHTFPTQPPTNPPTTNPPPTTQPIVTPPPTTAPAPGPNGCANNPTHNFCTDTGTCTVNGRSPSGVPSTECRHNYCCCAPAPPTPTPGAYGCSLNPARNYCSDGGTCTQRTGRGVPSMECGHNYCECAPP